MHVSSVMYLHRRDTCRQFEASKKVIVRPTGSSISAQVLCLIGNRCRQAKGQQVACWAASALFLCMCPSFAGLQFHTLLSSNGCAAAFFSTALTHRAFSLLRTTFSSFWVMRMQRVLVLAACTHDRHTIVCVMVSQRTRNTTIQCS
jgi:hypothetical protein